MIRRSFLLVAAMPFAARAQDARTEFIVRKGKDTLAVERFSRDAATLTLTGTLSQSNGIRSEYVVNLRTDASVEHLEMQRQGPQGPAATLSIDFGDTLVNATADAGGQTQKFSLPTRAKPMPFLVNSFALAEQIARASHLEVGKTMKWTAVRLGAGDTASMSVARPHADSVVISVPNGDLRLAVSKDGDVLGATFPAQQWTVERKKMTSKP
jgi:hypothetical protein